METKQTSVNEIKLKNKQTADRLIYNFHEGKKSISHCVILSIFV